RSCSRLSILRGSAFRAGSAPARPQHRPCRQLLGSTTPFLWLPLQISYEASLETLSLKRLYPAFLRTIPSDRQQVKAIFLLLQRFGWTWVALLGSNNAYGRNGLDALYELLSASDVCVAYRGIIPTTKDASSRELHNLVRILVDSRVNVTVVFSNRRSAHVFFEVVVQRNVTGMVWVGSEDWSVAQTIWQVPGIQSIGPVIGMLVEKTEPTMLERFEAWRAAEESEAERAGSAGAGGGSTQLDCTQRCTHCRSLASTPDVYDAQATFNVYSAVYAVAHGLHDLLGCAAGACSKGPVYPWQLLQKIKQVNFTLYKSRISFDANGDIHKGYDIIMWNWSGPSWGFDVIGTFSVNPDRLSIDQSKILWHTSNRQAPPSLCSVPCQPDLYSCQSCGADEWAPARSEACFERTVEFLSWSEPLSWALLTLAVLLLLLMAALAVLFALNTSTPVVKSAGGKMCFLMLGSETHWREAI
ncbi:zinc finger and BTB domain containing 48, partial [Columba livia]